ncbi:MAG: Wzz/FepE/Etk N-terminal domain-containing protein [Caldilinea sp.]
MSVHTSQNPTPVDAWEADDEIDLRKYIDVLIKRWREIVVFTLAIIVLAAAAVLIMRFVQTPMYEADSSVAIIRTQTEVNFDERFTTSSSDVTNADVGSRRGALLGLVFSGAIAERVIADLGDQLEAQEREPATLLRRIDAELSSPGGRTTQSDLIVITASADSPEKASAIANAWAQYYVQEVNRIYGQVPDEMMASVQTELDQAKTLYAAAQRNLEQFLATSPVNSLRRQSEETREAIAALQRANTDALSSYVEEILASYKRIVSAYLTAQTDSQVLGFQREQQTQRQLLNAYFRAYNDAVVDSFDTQRERDTRLIRMYYDQWLRTAASLATARTLQAGLTEGGDGAVASTATALQLLKLQLVSALTSDIPTMQNSQTGLLQGVDTLNLNAPLMNSSQDTPAQPVQNVQTIQPDASAGDRSSPPLFQINLSPVTDATLDGLSADLDGVIQSLEQQMSGLEQEIVSFNETWLSGERYQNLATRIPDESSLVEAIRTQYPELFSRGLFSSIAEHAAQGSTIAKDGQAQAAELLKLAGAETMLLSSQPNAPMEESIVQLEDRFKMLQSQLEEQNAINQQVTQQRDLTWESFTALSNKQAELTLERAAANSEVRRGTPAIPPDEPVQGVSLLLSVMLAGVVGLLLAIFLAFLLEYLGKPPLFTRASSAA